LFIHDLPNLETLKLDNIKYNGISLHGHTCPKLKLKHLDISHNNGDGSGSIFITGWDSLQSLDVSNVTADNIGSYAARNLKKLKCNNIIVSNLILAGNENLNFCNIVDTIDISNSKISSASIRRAPITSYINANNTSLRYIQIYACSNLRRISLKNSHIKGESSAVNCSNSPLLETIDMRNAKSDGTSFDIDDICHLKNIYCENAIGFRFVFRGNMKQMNITEDLKNCNVTFYGKCDTLNISNYNENTLLINDCNYLDVYNSKIGFNKLNTVNKKANFANSVCDNLVYNNFANGCYLNFENTILNQINGNADAEPVNANCSFYQSYTEWYNHFPR